MAEAQAATADWHDTIPLDELTRLIVERHHQYVRDAIPVITAGVDRVASHHGAEHPHLVEVQETFHRLADELITHMAKEENILFPFIDALALAEAGGRAPSSPFGTIGNPVRVMEADHYLATQLTERLRALTNGYEPPPEACTTYRSCFDELAKFEADLLVHIHLENEVLFVRAQDLERRLV